jgi:ATP-binding cassette, subfamily B, bacterial PglK
MSFLKTPAPHASGSPSSASVHTTAAGTVANYRQLWSYLAPYHRLGAMALIVGNLAAAVLEVLGLALFGVVLLRITQGGGMPPGFWLTQIAGATGSADLRVVTVACGVVYVSKNALMAALAWLETRLTFGVQTHLSLQALGSILRQDYEVTSHGDGSASVNLLMGGMGAISHNVLLPVLTFLAEGVLMVALVIFLLYTQPLFSAGMLATLGIMTGLLVLVSRRIVLHLGRERHQVEDERLRLLTGIFGHLREMYIYSAGPRAVSHLDRQMARLGRTYRGFQMLASTPRFVLEVTLVSALLVAVFLRLQSGLESTLVVSIGVFGVAGFRLLLGINRVVASVQAMRFAGAVVDRVMKALASPAAPAAAGRGRSGAPDGSLRLSGVTYAYPNGKPVLHGVDFELPRRSLIAIKGRSGAGKSTLLEIMAGLRTPSHGVVELDGERIAHKQALVGRVAYAGQQPAVFPDTIRANVAFGLAPQAIDDDAVWRALARAHLDELVRGLPGQLDFLLWSHQSLSGGQIQRLALARAIYMDCDYLLLDEPTAALDAETEQQLLATFKELAATTGVVVVSHRPAPIKAADIVWELIGGRLVPLAAPPSEVEELSFSPTGAAEPDRAGS